MRVSKITRKRNHVEVRRGDRDHATDRRDVTFKRHASGERLRRPTRRKTAI
jgi:hypothetical protein